MTFEGAILNQVRRTIDYLETQVREHSYLGEDEIKKVLWAECADKIDYMLKPFGKGGDGFTTFWL